MLDREKVQHGLACCHNNNCGACPYSAIKKCQHKLHNDAYTLLNEQEARLLTFDELINFKNVSVWAELYSPRAQKIALIYCTVRKNNDIPFLWLLEEDSGTIWCRADEDYNRSDFFDFLSGWRCWNSYPTVKQRISTQWRSTRKVEDDD